LALFASTFAPFGGLMGSAVKRVMHTKDFGHSIPGHGGVMDRIDCHTLMGIFIYYYYYKVMTPPTR